MIENAFCMNWRGKISTWRGCYFQRLPRDEKQAQTFTKGYRIVSLTNYQLPQ